ncbi:hypothetical protein D9611_008930 [Ephemerocybe angulata]|uniref:Arrestin-like N-terminal domain-containing protein n=1 Tax=Ephemerocybe angulata TaxID=980116 RepID=A0A8H5BYK7_9AGAR|nr:hypothetical protein D9611_008930 [Tulosesus angulatus]
MSFWKSRTSWTRSTPEPTEDGPSQSSSHRRGTNPPRYSSPLTLDLPPLHQAPIEPSYRDSQQSISSFETSLTSPTYATYENPFAASSATLTNPPRYSAVTNTRDETGFGAAPKEFTFSIGKSTPWATLRLYSADPLRSRAASRKGRHPRFTNVDNMFGNIELSLTSPQTIRSIKLILKGTIITSCLSTETGLLSFLDHTYIVWDRKFGDPKQLSQPNSWNSSRNQKFDGKLEGNWIFPFSIPFPTHVDLTTLCAVYTAGREGPIRLLPHHCIEQASGVTPFPMDAHTITATAPGSSRSRGEDRRGTVTPFLTETKQPIVQGFSSMSIPATASSSAVTPYVYGTSPTGSLDEGVPLPQSFLEREIGANIQYELVLSISHGRFASESRIETPLVYTPKTLAPPMSLPRQIAYRRREPPPGPGVDREGWHQLPPTAIRGMYLQQHDLTIVYTLYLANPLSYARGTLIPCCLTIRCDDINALNIFADPRSPRVRLSRATRFLLNHHKEDGLRTEFAASPTQPMGNVTPLLPIKLANTASQLTQRKSSRRTSQDAWVEVDPFPASFSEQVPSTASSPVEMLGSSDEDDEQEVGSGAVWWVPQGVTQEPRTRRLMGEIHLPKALQPTCTFPLFNILYRVDLLAPTSHAFEPDLQSSTSRKGKSPTNDLREEEGGRKRVYASQSVEVTTDRRDDEPTPIRFVKREEDFTVST